MFIHLTFCLKNLYGELVWCGRRRERDEWMKSNESNDLGRQGRTKLGTRNKKERIKRESEGEGLEGTKTCSRGL